MMHFARLRVLAMRFIPIALTLSLFSVPSGAGAQPAPAVDAEVERLVPSGRAPYFPDGVWGDPVFLERWFGNQLAAMREPVLRTVEPTDSRNAYVMRILFLPSFHPAYAVRIDTRGRRPVVRMTTLTGAGGYGPGRIAATHTETIRRDLADTVAALNRAVEIDAVTARFNRDSVDGEDIVVCADGLNVVVELVDEGGYHVFERHECNLDGRLRDAVLGAATIAAPLPEHIRSYL